MNTIAFLILFSGVFLYSVRIVFFLIGVSRENKKTKKTAKTPYVSVIVPARNEEDQIHKCIESILANDYPKNKYELIPVNDRSTDRTFEIMESFKRNADNIKIVNLTEDNKERNLKGKPGALEAGINQAKGELIIMTDADCIVGPKWISTIVENFDDDTAMIPSFAVARGKRIFDHIQAVEWIFTNTLARAAVGNNQYLGCFGNNLSIRKKVYTESGGYSNINFSVTEDLALLREVMDSGGAARYLLDENAAITTRSCKNLKEYISQHHRWAKGGQDLGWKGIMFVISTLTQWIGIIASIVFLYWGLAAVIIGVRIIGDSLLIFPSTKKINRVDLGKWVIPAIIFLLLFEPFVPLLLFKRNIVWKDQVFKRNAT